LIEGEAQNPLAFHLSLPTFGHLRLARSALLGCGVAPFALGDQKAIPSATPASAVVIDHPVGSPLDHSGRLFPFIAYVSPSEYGF